MVTRDVQPSVPILCYHAVATSMAGPDGRFAVSPWLLRQHLDLIGARGYTTVAVRDLLRARAGLQALPDHPVVITFDDGFADVLHQALPLLLERGFNATIFVTTGCVSPRASEDANRRLTWPEIVELDRYGIEVGAHGHDHIEMDLAHPHAIERELSLPKALLEDQLGRSAETFAYPYGYSTSAVRARAATAGYRGACGVKHALSTANDDLFDLARLRVLGRTNAATLGRWLDGNGVRTAPCRERPITRLWRLRRRFRHAVSERRRTR